MFPFFLDRKLINDANHSYELQKKATRCRTSPIAKSDFQTE